MSFTNKRMLLVAILVIVFSASANFAMADTIVYNTCLTPQTVYVGSGNSPCNWGTLTTTGGVQLGLTDVERGVSAIVPTGDTNAPGDTYLVTPGNGALSAQDFGFSIYDPNGLNPAGATLTMTDLTHPETFSFNPLLDLPDNGYLNDNGATTATGTFAQYGATSIGAQNYENDGFFAPFFTYNSSMAGDTFEYTLDYTPTTSVTGIPGVDPQLGIFQAATPEPGTVSLLSIAGIGMILAERRRRRSIRNAMRP